MTGARLRATMATYFAVGALLSLLGLAVVGELDAADSLWALGLAPFLVLGFLLADAVRQHVDAGRTRAAVLSVCAASAIALVVRSAFG